MDPVEILTRWFIIIILSAIVAQYVFRVWSYRTLIGQHNNALERMSMEEFQRFIGQVQQGYRRVGPTPKGVVMELLAMIAACAVGIPWAPELAAVMITLVGWEVIISRQYQRCIFQYHPSNYVLKS